MVLSPPCLSLSLLPPQYRSILWLSCPLPVEVIIFFCLIPLFLFNLPPFSSWRNLRKSYNSLCKRLSSCHPSPIPWHRFSPFAFLSNNSLKTLCLSERGRIILQLPSVCGLSHSPTSFQIIWTGKLLKKDGVENMQFSSSPEGLFEQTQ